MTRDLSEYDIFVSYASVDNTGGWIRAFVDALEQEYLSFTGDRELRGQRTLSPTTDKDLRQELFAPSALLTPSNHAVLVRTLLK
jgi:hypothetical protein